MAIGHDETSEVSGSRRRVPAIYGARDELWAQLINGAILATGFELAADSGAVGKRVTIPPADWIDLHFPGDDRIKCASRSVFFHPTLPGLHARMLQEDTSFDGPDRVRSESGVAYFAVRILRTDILDMWPRMAARLVAGQTGPRPRGPKPIMLDSVMAKMRSYDKDALAAMKEEEMVAAFGGSRDTCRRARRAVSESE